MDFRAGILGVFLVSIFSVVFAAPWDFLRGPVEWVGLAEPVVVWLMLVVSAVVFGIALLAVRKKYSKRLVFVSAAFGLFFLKSLLLMLDVYVSSGNFMNYALQSFFDLLIVGCLFVALFWK